MDERGRNALSVRLELQADCYAGVWGFFAQKRNLLEPGDIEEGLRAAAAVGDDRIQKQTQGNVVPESFTHGSAQQRTTWFKPGLETGDMRNCNTFDALALSGLHDAAAARGAPPAEACGADRRLCATCHV